MEALGINLGFLIFQVLNFTIVMILLYAWAYKPIINMLKKREETIAKSLEDARVASEARENAEEEARQIIADAQSEAAARVREATERAEEAARDVQVAAEAEATKAHQAAIAEAEQERDRVLADIRGQVAALAMAAAQKLVDEALDETRQRALIDAFFSGVKDGKVVVLEDVEASGASAEIISALPLTEEEQTTVRHDITTKLGSQTVTFRVDPNILGGLVIKIGDKVVDGSVAGQLDALRQRLG
jgi:F-type H+-transporting ATPase subunit b